MKLVTAPVPSAAREAEADDEERLQRDRQRRRARQLGEAARRCRAPTRAPPVGAQRERDERHRQRHDARSASGPQAHATMPSSSTRQRITASPSDAAERVAGGRRGVAVERGEPARRERAKRCATAAGTRNDERVGGRLLRARRQPAGELLRASSRSRATPSTSAGTGDDRERERVRARARSRTRPPRARARAAAARRRGPRSRRARGRGRRRRRRRTRPSRRRDRTRARSRCRRRPRGR